MPIDTNMMANFSLMDSVDVLRLGGGRLLLLYLQNKVLMGVRARESEMDFVIRIKSWLYFFCRRRSGRSDIRPSQKSLRPFYKGRSYFALTTPFKKYECRNSNMVSPFRGYRVL